MNYKTFNQKMKRLFSMPPTKAVKKIINKIGEGISDKISQNAAFKSIEYMAGKSRILYGYISISQFDISMLNVEQSEFLCDMYLKHYFDLLGSGPVKVDYNIDPPGIEGIKYDMSPRITKFDCEGEWLKSILLDTHIGFAKDIWKKVDRGYVPIDWQMDFKSGFRYSQGIWYKRQPIGSPRGADIKVPWEISRLQHLPRLAVFSLILPDKRDSIIKEFKNEVYDFAAANPVSMGANWACTMDVGIRAANILIAYDILKGVDEKNILEDDFQNFLGSLIYRHGEFIINNLEWNDGNHNNHYLSDVCGLLFAAAYLERNEKVDSWLAFSVQEIICCMEKQFYSDGGNFEASTSYHRLSGELMAYSTALIFGLLKTDKAQALKKCNIRLVKRLLSADKQKFDLNSGIFFPGWYMDRLFKAGCLTADIMKMNGKIPQIGDNDSGRFFKFSPSGSLISADKAKKKYLNLRSQKINNSEPGIYYDEDMLNHSDFISAISGLFDYDGFNGSSSGYPLERSIVESLSRGFKIKKEYETKGVLAVNKDMAGLKYYTATEIKYKDYVDEIINVEDIKFIPYPDFGLYIFKGSRFYISIFAGGVGQNGAGGHSHNDKLSFELCLCGKDIFIDPGTYLYTSLPKKRNMFRSAKAHNVPVVSNNEQNELLDLFLVKDETKCHVLEHGKNHIKLYLTYRDVVSVREFIICPDKLIINDSCNKDFYVNLNDGLIYSNGYGKLINEFKKI